LGSDRFNGVRFETIENNHEKESHRIAKEDLRHDLSTPVAHHLGWTDVRSLLAVIAEISSEQNGNLKVTRNGQTMTLHPSRDKQVAATDELMQIRHFLQRSGVAALEGVAAGMHLLVVIDHRAARVYRAELQGAVFTLITPYDPHGHGRHLHYVQDDSNGQRKPERKGFYDAVVKTLQGAERILLFGHATGASSAVAHLLAELRQHHAELADRVVGSLVVDEPHLTEDQLLAKACAYFQTMTTA
jgi:hypothetical protein